MNCQIFKSLRKADTYIYLPANKEFESIPEALRQAFGMAEKVMDLNIDQDTRLAIADVTQVLKEIAEQGFYLQMPPGAEPGGHDPWA